MGQLMLIQDHGYSISPALVGVGLPLTMQIGARLTADRCVDGAAI